MKIKTNLAGEIKAKETKEAEIKLKMKGSLSCD